MSDIRLDLEGARILVVDDQPENLDVMCLALETAQYQVLIATSGVQALSLAGRVKPDLILLDVRMPEMDGFETCEKLRENEDFRDIPVIFVTASDDTEDVVRGFDVGAVDYVVKPVQKDEVLARVKTHLERSRLMMMLAENNNELQSLTQELQAEIAQRQALSNRLDEMAAREAKRWGIEGIVGQSQMLQNILQDIQMLQHANNTSVLITGESGTGKELIARAFHAQSSRSDGPFVPVNCATIPKDLAESLLFGHLKGAFTGAEKDQTGYFDLANGGTLFLDEIGDMPYDLQIKLLRVLEDGHVMPLGAQETHEVDVRIVAATNVDLSEKMQSGVFRQDLFYRIARFMVQVPPLRDRKEDIPLLAQHFLNLFALEMGIETPTISSRALTALGKHDYPGNIRELKNVVERALIESRGDDIQPRHLPLMQGGSMPKGEAPKQITVDDFPLRYHDAELAVVKRAVERAEGNMSEAARLLEIDRAKVYRILGREKNA